MVQHVLEHGAAEDRHKIISAMRDHILMFSTHKFASNVVEKSLIFGSQAERRIIIEEVLTQSDRYG